MSDELRIELDPGATPIAGRICPATGRPLSFAGYVELIAALEGLRLADRAGGGDGTGRNPAAEPSGERRPRGSE